jgi:hypothetical protein
MPDFMKFVTEHFKRRDALYFVLAAASVILYVAIANGGFPLDDSWIHQVYARNLALRGEWAFVPGVPSAASTSPLYTVFLAAGYRLGISYQFWTHMLGIVALTVAAILGARIAEYLLPGNRWAGLITGLAVVLAWHLIWAAASGMETMLFSMWTVVLIAGVYYEMGERSQKTQHLIVRGAGFGVLAALTTLTRPEGVVLAGLIGLTLLVTRPRSALFWGAGAVLAYVMTLSPYLMLNLRLTGGLLPDTAAAKQAENAPLLLESFATRFGNMITPLSAGGQTFLLPGVFYYGTVKGSGFVQHWRNRIFDFLPLIWTLVLISLYALRLPAYYQHGRYVIPALPAFIIVGVVGAIGLVQWGQKRLIRRVLTRALALSGLVGFVYFGYVQGPLLYRTDVSIIDQEMVATARWIAEHLPPEQTLAIHDIGAVGYFAPRPILDLAGLVSPEIIPFINDKEPLWDWLYKRGAQHLMAFPDQVPGDDAHDPRLCPMFTTNGPASASVGGPSMTVYSLSWDGACPKD